MARMYRRRFTRRRTFKRQKNVAVVGPRREHVCHQQLSTRTTAPYTESIAGNGPSFMSSSSGALAWYQMWYFDPSGFIGPTGAQVPGSTVNPNTGSTADGWTRFAAIYAYYKVTSITLNFHYTTAGNADFGPPILYINREFEYNASAPTIADTSNQTGWLRKEFDSNSETFRYTFKPRITSIEDNRGVTTTDPRGSTAMPWTNVSTPAELLGIKVMLFMPLHTNPGIIQCNIVYNCLFKDKQV